MTNQYIPINKGNYSMDTVHREIEFEKKKGFGWERSIKNIDRNGLKTLKIKLLMSILYWLISN